jgi:hypothetical protein
MGRTADDVALDQHHFGAEPGSVRGGGVARRPATEDHEARHDLQDSGGRLRRTV